MSDNIIPRFYMKPVRNGFQSEAQGREVFDEVEYVEMIIPGDKLTEVHIRVKAEHRERWPDRYKAFKESRETPETGTPLEEWPAVNTAQVMEFKSSHVRTVEQLAALSDTQLSKVSPMGGHALREKARRFVEGVPDSARIAQLEAMVASLQAAAVKKEDAE